MIDGQRLIFICNGETISSATMVGNVDIPGLGIVRLVAWRAPPLHEFSPTNREDADLSDTIHWAVGEIL